MYIAQECGQKWYRLHSWRSGKLFRTFKSGFAIGPIMFISSKWESKI